MVEGTIAPWLFDLGYFQGPLIDPGIFAPAGTSLTGMPIHIVWNDNPVTAAVTINGTTVTLGPVEGFNLPYAEVIPTFQNITVRGCVDGNVAVDSFDPAYAATHNPNGLGGSLELLGPNNAPLGGVLLRHQHGRGSRPGYRRRSDRAGSVRTLDRGISEEISPIHLSCTCLMPARDKPFELRFLAPSPVLAFPV